MICYSLTSSSEKHSREAKQLRQLHLKVVHYPEPARVSAVSCTATAVGITTARVRPYTPIPPDEILAVLQVQIKQPQLPVGVHEVPKERHMHAI